MENSKDPLNEVSDLRAQQLFWGRNYDCYRQQLLAGRYLKWNWAAFIFSVPWMISKQLYKKALIIVGIGAIQVIIARAVELFRIDLYWMCFPMAFLSVIGVSVFVAFNANRWAIERYKKEYRSNEVKGGHREVVRLLIFFAISGTAFLLRMGADFSLQAFHSKYVYKVADYINMVTGHAVICDEDNSIYYPSEKIVFEKGYMGNESAWPKYSINKVDLLGADVSKEYEWGFKASYAEVNSLFKCGNYIFHFMQIFNERGNSDYKIFLYKWKKDLSDFEYIEIDADSILSESSRLDGSIYSFEVKSSNEDNYLYKINLDLMTFTKEGTEALPDKPRRTRTQIEVPGTSVSFLIDEDHKNGGGFKYKYRDGEKIKTMIYSGSHIGRFEQVDYFKDYVVIQYTNKAYFYSITEDKTIISPGERCSNLIPTDDGLLFIGIKKAFNSDAFLRVYLFTGNPDEGYFKTRNLPMFSNFPEGFGSMQVEPLHLLNSGDSYIFSYRSNIDEVRMGRLSKNLEVIPFKK